MRDGSLVHASALSKLLPSLKAASVSHPRLHAVWHELLDLLCPCTPPSDAPSEPPPPTPSTTSTAAAVEEEDASGGKKTSKQRKAIRQAAAMATAEVQAVAAAGAAAASKSGGGVPSGASPLFRRFWQEIVEEGLIPSTLERKYMAFTLLQATLPRLCDADGPLVLSPGLVRCLVNALEGPDRLLRPVAAATVARLVERARSSTPLRIALVSQLLSRASRGAGQERADSSRALRQLVSQGLDPSGEDEYSSFLLDYFATGSTPALAEPSLDAAGAPTSVYILEQERAHAREANRKWAIEQLYSLSKGSLAPARAPPLPKLKAQQKQKKRKRKKGAAADTEAEAVVEAVEEEEPAPPVPHAPPTPPLRTLRFLFASAFFSHESESISGSNGRPALASVGGMPQPAPSDAVRTLCAARFFSLLGESSAAISAYAHAASHHHTEGGASGSGGASLELELLEGCQAWWSELAPHGLVLQPEYGSVDGVSAKSPTWQPVDASLTSSRSEALKLIAQLRSRRMVQTSGGANGANGGKGGATAITHKQLAALELLAHHLALQLLSQPKEAASAIDELPACVVALRTQLGELPPVKVAKKAAKKETPAKKGALNGKKAGGEDAEEAEGPPAVVEVVVDILLALLVQPSAMLREVARSVVRPFGDELTEGTIELLLHVLRAPVGGDDEGGGEEDDEDGGEEEESEDDDVEEMPAGSAADALFACEPCNEPAEEESEEEDNSEDERMVQALEQAAGLRATDSAAAESEGESEVEMPDDPEDMARLDAQLAAMVRERVEAQSATKERREQQLHFKMRTLELLETLARRPNPSPMLLLLPVPLLRVLAEAAAQPALRPLFERTSGLVRQRLCKLTLRPPWPEQALPAARLLQELEGSFVLASRIRGGGAGVAAAVSDVVMLLLRTMVQHHFVEGEAMVAASAAPSPGVDSGVAGCLNAPVLALLTKHLTAFYGTKNCRLNGRVVTALLERFPLLGWAVAPLLAVSVGSARDAYLCGEACTHLCSLLAQRHAAGQGAAKLLPHVATLEAGLVGLLGREKLRAKHLLPPIRLAGVLVKTLQAAQQVEAARATHAGLSAAVEAVRAKHGKAKALVGSCDKFIALSAKLHSQPSKKAKPTKPAANKTKEKKPSSAGTPDAKAAKRAAAGATPPQSAGKKAKTKV